MELILTQKVEGLGERGDVVTVKKGYARNYLFPKGFAVPATERQKKILEKENRLRELKDDKVKRNVQVLADKMKDLSCTIVVQAGEEDKLYGSVSTHDIAGAIKNQGFEIDHKQVILEEPIKRLGVYNIPIRLHREVEFPIKVWVVRE